MAFERGSSSSRGYDYKWQRYRLAFLREHPLCAMCMQLGRTTPSSVVDHKIPHKGDDKLFRDPNNHQALCKPCHDRHKKRQEMSGVLPGCDVDGIPLDPHHPWRLVATPPDTPGGE